MKLFLYFWLGFLGIVTLVLSSDVNATAPIHIFDRLIKANNMHNVEFSWSNEGVVSAYPDRRLVAWTTLTNQLCLKSANYDNCVAGLLAHELVHIRHNDRGSSHFLEYRADRESVGILRKAGYDGCSGLLGLYVGMDIFGNRALTPDTHPDFDDRIERLKKACGA